MVSYWYSILKCQFLHYNDIFHPNSVGDSHLVDIIHSIYYDSKEVLKGFLYTLS